MLVSETVKFFIPSISKDKIGSTLYYCEISPIANNSNNNISLSDIERILSNYSSLYTVSSTIEDISSCPSTAILSNNNEIKNQSVVEDENELFTALSPMSLSINVSATSHFNAVAKTIKSNEYPLISLAVGEPDFHPPKEVIKATGRAAEDGYYRYSPILGLESLRQLISNDYKVRKHVDYNINEICLCNGATQADTEVYYYYLFYSLFCCFFFYFI